MNVFAMIIIYYEKTSNLLHCKKGIVNLTGILCYISAVDAWWTHHAYNYHCLSYYFAVQVYTLPTNRAWYQPWWMAGTDNLLLWNKSQKRHVELEQNPPMPPLKGIAVPHNDMELMKSMCEDTHLWIESNVTRGSQWTSRSSWCSLRASCHITLYVRGVCQECRVMTTRVNAVSGSSGVKETQARSLFYEARWWKCRQRRISTSLVS